MKPPYHVEGLETNEADGTAIEHRGVIPYAPWRKHLVYDDRVSASIPVIRGTRVRSDTVIKLVARGLTWNQILERHPELTESDIRACLSYALDQHPLSAQSGFSAR